MSGNPYEPANLELSTAQAHAVFGREDRSLRYAIDFDDIMQFQRFHFAHSPTVRNQRYGLMGFTALVTFVFFATALAEFSPLEQLTTGIVAAISGAMAVRALLQWSITSQTRKLLREGNNEGIIGDHELRIGDNGLTELTPVNETRNTFSGIARIEETDDYAFIYISALQAHVIPKKKIVSGDIAAFMARLRELSPNGSRRTTR